MTAHKLKNYDSKLSCTLRNEYTYQNSLLLTGTPLQNNTGKSLRLLLCHHITRLAFTKFRPYHLPYTASPFINTHMHT